MIAHPEVTQRDLPNPRTFVARATFLSFAGWPSVIDAESFRAVLDSVVDPAADDAYSR